MLAHTQQVAADEVTTTATDNHVTLVQRAYAHLDFGQVKLITSLPFHVTADSSEATQQLIDGVNPAMVDTHRHTGFV